MTQEKTLVLVDGSALAFRSFYALMTAGMRTSGGISSWAVYGFFKALFDLLERDGPEMMAVCFDLAAPTFRHVEYDKYKANRLKMPDELASQWPLIKRGVEVLSIPVLELEGFEADDVIGTIAKHASASGHKVTILTGDQDAFQLLDENIQVLMPGRDGLTFYGRAEVFAKLAVYPEQIVDYKALCGDASDNIPGVKGIGPKTASTLLTDYKTLQGVYDNLDNIKSSSTRQKLEDGRESAWASQRLATIRLDVPLDFHMDNCTLRMPDTEKVVAFLREMEFNTFLKNLPRLLAPFNQGVAPVLEEKLLVPASGKRSGFRSSRQATIEPEVVVADATGQLSIPHLAVAVADTVEPLIVRNDADLDKLVSELRKQTVLSVDLETTGLQSLCCDIVGYALAWSDSARFKDGGRIEFEGLAPVRTAYVPVRHKGEEQLSPERVGAALRPFMEARSTGKIAQNAKYETNCLSIEGIPFRPLAFDPMLASYIVNPDDSHGLKEQSERILNHTMVRIAELIGTGRKLICMSEVPVAKAAPYAADDARIALELTRYYSRRLDDEQRYLLYEMELPLVPVLARMEQAGVTLDLPYLADFSRELADELRRLEIEICELAGHPFNVNSTQQLQKVLFEELKLTVNSRFKTKGGGYSTDASVLQLIAKEHPIVPKILEYRQNSKLRSTYVEALPRQVSSRDNRLHGDFNQVSTATGRLSSSNPNLQNIPIKTELGRRIRRAFIPGQEGALLLSADYSQIELRLLAHMSGDETLIEAFSRGEDIHAHTASEIFDLPIDQVDSEKRRVGKTINFSLVYQQGAYSTAIDLGISRSEAQSFIDKYFQRYPKVKSFMAETIEEARRTGYVKTLWGRKRYFRNLNDRNDTVRRAGERAAGNAPLQGSAADLMKLAMIRLDKALEANKLSGKLILQVHDELVLAVPEKELEQTRQMVLDAMEMDQPLKVPLKVDTGAGPTWMEAKS